MQCRWFTFIGLAVVQFLLVLFILVTSATTVVRRAIGYVSRLTASVLVLVLERLKSGIRFLLRPLLLLSGGR